MPFDLTQGHESFDASTSLSIDPELRRRVDLAQDRSKGSAGACAACNHRSSGCGLEKRPQWPRGSDEGGCPARKGGEIFKEMFDDCQEYS